MFKKLFGIATIIATIIATNAQAATNQVAPMVAHSTIKPLTSLQDMNDSSSRWDIFVGTLNTTFGTGFAYIDGSGNLARLAYGTSAQYYRADGTLQTLDTSVVPENTNLYFTNARFDTRFATKTTTDLAEGTNLYYTTARFDTQLATKTTTNLAEGSNLYFTDARAIAAPISGYTSGAGTVAATDTILQAIQKLNGNIALKADDSAVVKLAGTQTITGAKTFDEALTLTQVSTPANPAAGKNKIYVKSDDKVYKLTSAGVESEVGSGSGGAGGSGTNLLLFDTSGNSYAATKTNNFNADVSVGDWLAYADAAGTAPVDMTGGSPNTTFARNTSSPLNGAGDFLMTVTTGASRQGEGASVLVNVPPAYRGKNLAFKFPFSSTGTLVEDDFKLFAYDITNSVIIIPFTASKILGAAGTAYAIFPTSSSTATMRVGVHIARTTTGAATLNMDDVQVSPDVTPVGMAGSDWIAYTPTITGFGTPSSVSFHYKVVGDSYLIKGSFVAGTTTGVEARVSIPFTVDSSKVTSKYSVGIQGLDATRSGVYNWVTLVEGGLSYLTMGRATDGGVANLSSINANQYNSGEKISISTDPIPASGRATNVNMADSSVFMVSNIIANGTRVTSAPTKLGEYRTYKKDSSAFTGTDDAPTTGWTPSLANGMRIEGVPYASAGNSGQPNRWEIFVGKNKNVFYEFYASAGRTGQISTDMFDFTGLLTWYLGVGKHYDPTTGIVTIDTVEMGSNTTQRSVGRTVSMSGGLANPTDCYFDIKVAENAMAIAVDGFSHSSQVFVTNGTGFGSTNTKIRRYTTVQINTGSDITYASSSTLGDSFTINKAGTYSIDAYDYRAAGGHNVGISVNGSALTTDIGSVSWAQGFRCRRNDGADNIPHCPVTLRLNAGDIVRMQGDANQDTSAGDTFTGFNIVRVN